MAKQFTAKDVLFYLFSDCVSWEEDVDGAYHDGGMPYAIVTHNVRISDGHLSELMDLAGIAPGRIMQTTLERLTQANEEYFAARVSATVE